MSHYGGPAATPEQRDFGFLLGTCLGAVSGALPAAWLALLELSHESWERLRASVEWMSRYWMHLAAAAGCLCVIAREKSGVIGLVALACLALFGDALRRELGQHQALTEPDVPAWTLVGDLSTRDRFSERADPQKNSFEATVTSS